MTAQRRLLVTCLAYLYPVEVLNHSLVEELEGKSIIKILAAELVN